jgi:hypothetical protein
MKLSQSEDHLMNAGNSPSRIVCVRAVALMWLLAAGFVLAVPHGPSGRADETGDRLTSRPAPKVTTPPTVKIGADVRTGAGERRRLLLEDGVELLVNQNTNLQYPERDVLKLTAGEVFVRVPARQRNQETAPFTLVTPQRQVRTGAGDLAVQSGTKGTSVLVTRGTAKVSSAGQQVDVAAGQQLHLDRNQPAPLPRA